MTTPQFEIVPRSKATPRPRRSERRDWKPTIEALVAGKIIFLSDSDLSDQDVKYLQLAFSRRGQGERLTTVRTVYKGAEGRQLELRK